MYACDVTFVGELASYSHDLFQLVIRGSGYYGDDYDALELNILRLKSMFSLVLF